MTQMRYFVVRTDCEGCTRDLLASEWKHDSGAGITVTELTTPEAIAAAERLVEGEK